MKFGNLVILIIVAAALGWSAIFLYQKQHESMTQDRAANGLARGQNLFEDLTDQAARLAKIEFTKTSETVTIVRDDEHEWVLASLNNYPADPAQVNKLVMEMTDIRVGDRQTAREEMYARFGLQGQVGSQGVIILYDSDDEPLATLMLGRERDTDPMTGGAAGMGGGRFVRVNDDPMIYLVQEQLYWLGTEVIDWVKREIMAVPADHIVALTIDHPTSDSVSVRWDGASPIVEGLDPEREEPNISELAAARGALNGLAMTDVITSGSAIAQSLEQVALFSAHAKDGTVYRVTVLDGEDSYLALSAYYDEPVFTAEDQSSTETLRQAEEEAEQAPDAIEPFNRRHGPWLYKVSSWNRDKFVKYRSDVVNVIEQEDDASWENMAPDATEWPATTDDEATTPAVPVETVVDIFPSDDDDSTTPAPAIVEVEAVDDQVETGDAATTTPARVGEAIEEEIDVEETAPDNDDDATSPTPEIKRDGEALAETIPEDGDTTTTAPAKVGEHIEQGEEMVTAPEDADTTTTAPATTGTATLSN